MNAYELADDVKNISNTIEALEWVQKASPLLRQQADRIERKQELIREQTALLVKQNNRIAELEKSHIELEKGIVADLNQRQSAKPVAWMDYLEHSNVYDLNVSGRGIPLYTTPQIKELSDEEIEDLIDNWDFGLDISPKHHMFLLCKTILKKASEK